MEMATSANKSPIYRKIVFQTKAREACIEKHKFHVCSTTCKEFEKWKSKKLDLYEILNRLIDSVAYNKIFLLNPHRSRFASLTTFDY
jgi:hypothetical protein